MDFGQVASVKLLLAESGSGVLLPAEGTEVRFRHVHNLIRLRDSFAVGYISGVVDANGELKTGSDLPLLLPTGQTYHMSIEGFDGYVAVRPEQDEMLIDIARELENNGLAYRPK